jgi:probable addiction module antidote protein
MGKIKLRKWNSAEHLKTDKDITAYLEACLAEAGDDPTFISKALGTIAKASGMSQLAQDGALGKKQPPI